MTKSLAEQLAPLRHEGGLLAPLKERIFSLRQSGRLKDAIALCDEAAKEYLGDPFYSKILSDLYFQDRQYGAAFVALADFLAKIPPSNKSMKDFANRYYRLKRALPSKEAIKFANLLVEAISQASLDGQISDRALEIIRADIHDDTTTPVRLNPELERFVELLNDDRRFDDLVRVERSLEATYPRELIQAIDSHVLNRPRRKETFRVDLHCVSIYEKLQKYDSALKVLSELLVLRMESVAIRSLFRICRLIKNYDAVDELIAKQPSLLKANEFNVLYELVYYFETRNNVEQLQVVLRTIEKRFAQNLPVLRTLKNFYIRFGMFDEAARLEPTILGLYRGGKARSGKFLEAIAESETAVASKVQELYSELEHQKQLAAISDLTTGISHELGQPITNIRYTVQFYRRFRPIFLIQTLMRCSCKGLRLRFMKSWKKELRNRRGLAFIFQKLFLWRSIRS